MFRLPSPVSPLGIMGALFLLASCSHKPVAPVESPAITPAPRVTEVAPASAALTTHYTVLEFETGKFHLPASEQEKIKNIAKTAQKYGRPVRDVRVLAWSDDAQIKDQRIAGDRAAEVRDLLKEDLSLPVPIETYNMGQQPEKFTELIRPKAKNGNTTFENTETTSFGKGPKSSLAGIKTSKAIIMVRYE